MIIKNYYTQACFEAWMNCENLLVQLAPIKNKQSKKVTRVIDECALICMGTFHAVKTHSVNLRKIALLCVGICEECAELCELQNDEDFLLCARVCRKCSNTISSLATEA
jgi:hypothetical protein